MVGLLTRRNALKPKTVASTSLRNAVVNTVADGGHTKFLFVGDSYGEGYGATAKENRMIDKLMAAFRTEYGVTGSCPGLLPRMYNIGSAPTTSWQFPTSSTSGVTAYPFFADQGSKGAQVDIGGHIEWTVTCTSVDIMFYCSPTAGGYSDIQVTVNGSPHSVIDASDDAREGVVIHHIDFGSLASRAIRLSPTGGDGTWSILVDGIIPYTSDSDFVYVDCTSSGVTSDFFSDDGDDYRKGWHAFGPHIVVDTLVGGNNFFDNTGTPASVAADLESRIAFYKTISSNPTIFVADQWALDGDDTPNGQGFTMADYYDACLEAASDDGTVLFTSLRDAIPDAEASDYLVGSHPNDDGQQAIADVFMSVLKGHIG